jgi:hypothetical protein
MARAEKQSAICSFFGLKSDRLLEPRILDKPDYRALIRPIDRACCRRRLFDRARPIGGDGWTALAYLVCLPKNAASEECGLGIQLSINPMSSWRARGWAFLAATGAFGLAGTAAEIPAKLGEHAALAWVNDQIAEHFGFRSPSVTDLVRVALVWGPASVLAAICVSGWVYALRLRREPSRATRTSPVDLPAPVPSPPAQPSRQAVDTEVLRGRIKDLLLDGDSLLSLYSFILDRSPDSRSKLMAWLISAGEITPGLVEMGRDHFAGQITKSIDDPSSGAVYEKVQRVHAILSELFRALPKADHS